MTPVALIPAEEPVGLRDVFAMTAPPCPDTFRAECTGFGSFVELPEQREARWRWAYADEMMRTR